MPQKDSWEEAKDQLAAFFAGVLMLLYAPYGIWTNESAAARNAAAYHEMSAKVVSAQPTERESGGEVRLVHVAGRATATQALSDRIFRVSAVALRLTRSVEMFQWMESSSTHDGHTNYVYSQGWSESGVDSSKFHDRAGHENPPIPVPSCSWNNADGRVGEFRLNGKLVAQIPAFTPLPVTEAMFQGMSPEVRSAYTLKSGALAKGDGTHAGDLRVTFTTIGPQDISVIAGSKGNALQPWLTASGEERQLLEAGLVDAPTMLAHLHHQDVQTVWHWRFGLLFAVWFGLQFAVRPMFDILAAVPVVGTLLAPLLRLLGMFATFALACVLTLGITAVAWLAVRPMLSAGLLATGAVLLFGFKRKPAAPPAA